jgi:hypothetical protein
VRVEFSQNTETAKARPDLKLEVRRMAIGLRNSRQAAMTLLEARKPGPALYNTNTGL